MVIIKETGMVTKEIGMVTKEIRMVIKGVGMVVEAGMITKGIQLAWWKISEQIINDIRLIIVRVLKVIKDARMVI